MKLATRRITRPELPGPGEQLTFVLSYLLRYGDGTSGTALDIPGGSGWHSLLLSALGMTVICADIDFPRLRQLREVSEALVEEREISLRSRQSRQRFPGRVAR